jgi:hypothetical protein
MMIWKDALDAQGFAIQMIPRTVLVLNLVEEPVVLLDEFIHTPLTWSFPEGDQIWIYTSFVP